jgi:hypothetical protein
LLQNCVMLSLKRIQKYDLFYRNTKDGWKNVKLFPFYQASEPMKTVPRK